MEDLLTYEQLVSIEYDGRTKIKVIYTDIDYQYLTNYRWVKNIYRGFFDNENIRFKIVKNS